MLSPQNSGTYFHTDVLGKENPKRQYNPHSCSSYSGILETFRGSALLVSASIHSPSIIYQFSSKSGRKNHWSFGKV